MFLTDVIYAFSRTEVMFRKCNSRVVIIAKIDLKGAHKPTTKNTIHVDLIRPQYEYINVTRSSQYWFNYSRDTSNIGSIISRDTKFSKDEFVQELSAITFQGLKLSYKVGSVLFYRFGDPRGARL